MSCDCCASQEKLEVAAQSPASAEAKLASHDFLFGVTVVWDRGYLPGIQKAQLSGIVCFAVPGTDKKDES